MIKNAYDPDNPPDVPEGISRRTMQELPISLVIADARLDDIPLIYVNSAFERVTGYSSSRVLGRNCRFLQGGETSEDDRTAIREALASGNEIAVDIVNYRADGDRFVNRLMITPLHNEDGELTHFLGLQTERADDLSFAEKASKLDESLREVQHRVKNHLSLLLALIRLEARNAKDVQTALKVLANRVEALNLLYDEFSTAQLLASGERTVGLGSYVSRVCSALNMLDGHREVRMNLHTDEVRADLDTASQVGLLVSELLTNALQHAFPADRSGLIDVKLWPDESGERVYVRVADDGTGLPEGSQWPHEGNLGARIVRDLVKRLDGSLDVESSKAGTTVTVCLSGSGFELG